MKKQQIFVFVLLAAMLIPFLMPLFRGCGNDQVVVKIPENKNPPKNVNIPVFDADHAFENIKKQVSYGPRVPNTPAHDSCAAWLARSFKAYGATVVVQEAKLTAYNGTVLNAKNIIASYNPEKASRILLCAHWDSRHVADHDPDKANHTKPILGADDGGSGVGVLLAIGKILQANPIDIGVDIVLFDAEDHGNPAQAATREEQEKSTLSWCLGSQYWAKNPHKAGYRALYGILLDMVGSKGARFPQEGTSLYFAPEIVSKVWKEAAILGYSSYFDPTKEAERGITDDHVAVNTILKIPTIDIINLPVLTQSENETGFGKHWHTQSDNLDVIDTATLKAVGQTLLNVLYKEAAGVY